MKNRVKGYLLEAPVVIIFTIVVLATFYIKMFNPGLFPQPINWATPVTLLVFLIMYFFGRIFENKTDSGRQRTLDFSSKEQPQEEPKEIISDISEVMPMNPVKPRIVRIG